MAEAAKTETTHPWPCVLCAADPELISPDEVASRAERDARRRIVAHQARFGVHLDGSR